MNQALAKAIEILLKNPEAMQLPTFKETMLFVKERMSPEDFESLKGINLLDIAQSVTLGTLLGE